MSGSAPASVSPLVKAGWAAGDVGIASYVVGTMGFLLFYLTEVHGIPPAWAGAVILVPRLIDVVLDPIMGAISDRTVTSMGRRRPYLLFGSAAFAVTFYLTFAMPRIEDWRVAAVVATGLYLLSSTAFTIYSIPHAAMAAEMSADYRERVSIVGYRMMGLRLGILAAAGLGPLLFSSRDSLGDGFRLFGAVFGLVILSGGLISFVATRHAPRREAPAAAWRWRDELRALTDNRPFRALITTFLLQNIAIGMSATTLVYFLTFGMRIELGDVGWFSAGAAVIAMIATPIWMRAGGTWGMSKKRVYATAIVIEIVAYAAIVLLARPDSLWVLVMLLVLVGIGDAACQLAPNSMVPDTVEADEVTSGTRREGTILGAMSGGLKLGMAAGAFLASVVFSLAGFVPGQGPGEQGPSAILGVRVAYALVPIALWIVALWRLRHYHLDEDLHKQLRRRIALGAAGDLTGNGRGGLAPESSDTRS
jgi:GPH family glycoside/pentoside/hexuronide:cation symporter